MAVKEVNKCCLCLILSLYLSLSLFISVSLSLCFALLRMDMGCQVTSHDVLDVYIEHRMLLRSQHHRQEEDGGRNPRNEYPPELVRRL